MIHSNNKSTLVIGIGNDFRGDDGIGLYLVRELVNKKLNLNIIAKEYQGDGTDLFDLWKGFDRVILVDCVQSNSPAGTIHFIEAHQKNIDISHLQSVSTHTFNLSQVVELARALNELPKKLLIFGIEGKNFKYKHGLSKELEHKKLKIFKQFLDILQK